MKWMELADCQFIDPDLFFPERGVVPRDARKICERCEVQTQCLQYALGFDRDLDRFGIFGGTTAQERNRLRDRVAR